MKILTILILAVVAVTLAGCNSTKDDPIYLDPAYEPGRITVQQLPDAPSKHVSWSQIPQNERPSELPPLFSKALQNQPNGHWGEVIDDERGQAIMDGLNEQWHQQAGSTPPHPLPVLYNGEFFDIFFGHSSTRTPPS